MAERRRIVLTATNTQENILTLYKKKLSLMRQIRRITESAATGGRIDAEKYIALVNQREKIVTELKQLDQTARANAPEFYDFTGEVSQIKSEIERIAGEVVALEEELTKSLPALMNEIKSNLKKAKDGQHLGRAYRVNASIVFGAQYDMKQ
ncbi:MAG: hypothetical protein LBT44_09525 [Clostridiales bacterium]|jgi:chromosome segregation ATPase|nr:hypothetical protein [Clostridiales bacterium]